MKRILFFVITSLCVIGCKDEKKVITTQVTSEKPPIVGCTDLSRYDLLNDVEEKAEWLRKNGANVCQDELNYRARKDHFVNDASIFSPTSGNPLVVKWSQIKLLIKKDIYENYITFDIDSHNNIKTITTKTRYTKYPYCFSMPLFRGIDKEMMLTDDSEFTFMTAHVGSTPAIFFKVTKDISRPNTDFAYYDFSDEPKKTPDGNLLNVKSPL